MTPSDQVLFCRLLSYFHHGDYATFKRICEMAYPQARTDRFFVANCFLSSHLSGMIEISDSERSTWWWASFETDIEIKAVRSKLIGTTKSWVEHKATDASPLITDSQGHTLLLGHDKPQSERADGIFGHSFFDRFPGFVEAELDVLAPESFRLELGKYIEVYDPEKEKWAVVDQNALSGANLIRVRKEFSGLTYYIINSDLGLLFRVLHPEWAFISALNLLSWPLTTLVQEGDQGLRLPRAIRLPAPILRYLFASSERCRIGPNIEFIEIEESARNRLRSYLNPQGSEYASKSH